MAETDVLKVQPDLLEIDLDSAWRTLKVPLGVGEQRQPKVSRPLANLMLTFKNPYVGNASDELTDFFNARKGSFEAFIIPSWKKDGVTTNVYFANAATVIVSNPARFSASAASISNFIVIGTLVSSDPFTWQMETSRILSIVGNTLTLTTPFTNSYPANSIVYQGFKVHFTEDVLPRKIFVGEVYESQNVSFTGDY